MNVRLLKNRNLTLLIMGQFVSNMGTVMQSFALSLYVLKITGSGAMFASVLAISIIPNIILGPFCGVFADWFNRKKIIVTLDMLSGIIIGMMYFISITVGIQIIHIYLTVIFMSLISCLFNPAISTAIPTIVKEEDLLEANSLNSFVSTLSNLIAPIIAAALYGVWGISVVLLFNSISFIISSISEMFISMRSNIIKREKISLKQFIIDFSEGINILKGHKLLMGIIIGSFFINFAYNPIMTMGFTYIGKMIVGMTDIQIGLLETSLVSGAVIGPLLVKIISNRIELSRIYLFSVLLTGLLFIFIALPTLSIINSITISFIILALSGFVIVSIVVVGGVCIFTVAQREIPNEYLGRVSSVWSALSMGAIPLGQLFFGFLFDNFYGYVPVLLAALIQILVAFGFSRVLKANDKHQFSASVQVGES